MLKYEKTYILEIWEEEVQSIAWSKNNVRSKQHKHAEVWTAPGRERRAGAGERRPHVAPLGGKNLRPSFPSFNMFV